MVALFHKRKKLRSKVALGALLLASCCICQEAFAQSNEDCGKPPSSPLVVNVRDKGAKGDGSTDDTASIQAAIDEIAGTKGTVLVPDGTYLVDAVGKGRLTLKGGMTLLLSPGATLKAIPTSEQYYSILFIRGASNVSVVGGTLEGEREHHMSQVGEGGMGIHISHGTKHIVIRGVTARKMWGDGFYVEGATDVTFASVTADDNRRQGLSVIDAEGVLVTNSTFKNSHGTRPSAGIDFEPDRADQHIRNVRIENSQFSNNAGAGILIDGGKGAVADVEIRHNVFAGAHPLKVKYAPGVLDAAIYGNFQQSPRIASVFGLVRPREVVAQREWPLPRWKRNLTATSAGFVARGRRAASQLAQLVSFGSWVQTVLVLIAALRPRSQPDAV
jgi:Pectate lyase superfamily protein